MMKMTVIMIVNTILISLYLINPKTNQKKFKEIKNINKIIVLKLNYSSLSN
jgi:hypothetical protein